MANTIQIQTSILAGGSSYGSLETFTDESLLRLDATLTKGQAGTLSTRTDDDEGTVTLGAAHGITTGQHVDIYWTVSGVDYIARDVTVGTVSETSVPITTGGTPVLPAQATAVIVSPISINTFAVSYADVDVIFARMTGAGSMDMRTDAASVLELTLAENTLWYWSTTQGSVNPLDADLTVFKASTKDVLADKEISVGVLMNSIV